MAAYLGGALASLGLRTSGRLTLRYRLATNTYAELLSVRTRGEHDHIVRVHAQVVEVGVVRSAGCVVGARTRRDRLDAPAVALAADPSPFASGFHGDPVIGALRLRRVCQQGNCSLITSNLLRSDLITSALYQNPPANDRGLPRPLSSGEFSLRSSTRRARLRRFGATTYRGYQEHTDDSRAHVGIVARPPVAVQHPISCANFGTRRPAPADSGL